MPGQIASRQDGSRVRCTGPNSWETLSFFGGKREMSEENFNNNDMMINDEMVAIPQKRTILRRRKYSLV